MSSCFYQDDNHLDGFQEVEGSVLHLGTLYSILLYVPPPPPVQDQIMPGGTGTKKGIENSLQKYIGRKEQALFVI